MLDAIEFETFQSVCYLEKLGHIEAIGSKSNSVIPIELGS